MALICVNIKGRHSSDSRRWPVGGERPKLADSCQPHDGLSGYVCQIKQTSTFQICRPVRSQ